MAGSKGIRATVAVVLIASLAGMILFSNRLLELMMLLLAACSIFVWFQIIQTEKKRMRNEHQTQLIRTINLHRHDWLNELQILFGYIRMKKYENLQAYVDKIKVKIHHESHVARLGHPEFIVYILTFHTVSRPLSLEVEVEQEIRLDKLPIDADRFFLLFRELCETFSKNAGDTESGMNVLSVSFDLEENNLLVDFVYQGACSCSELKKDLVRVRSGYPADIIEIDREQGEEKAVVTVRLPL